MIGRTVAGVFAALIAFWIAIGTGPDARPEDDRPTTSVAVTEAVLPIACPGSLTIPVGNIGGGDGVIGSGSDDIRESLFRLNADEPVATGDGWTITGVLATEIERVGDGDIAGLSAVPCLAPRTDTWLVGGSTAIGSSARLVLTNPTDVASDVKVTLYGPAGQVDQGLGIAVGPHSQSSYLLEGVTTGLATLVVHVEATAAGVTAVIQDSRLDGFLAAGTDWVVPNDAAGTELAIPGVGPSAPDGLSGASTVRLFAPDGATVSLRIAGILGSVPWPAGESITLQPGVVVDVNLPATDVATVLIEASAPIYAAGFTAVGRAPDEALQGTAVRDGAWVNAQAHRKDRSYSVVVPHYAVSAVAYSQESATFRALGPDGSELLSATIPAGQTREFPLSVPSGTLVTVEGSIAWSVRVRDLPGFIATVQPEDIGAVDTSIVVEPGSYVP